MILPFSLGQEEECRGRQILGNEVDLTILSGGITKTSMTITTLPMTGSEKTEWTTTEKYILVLIGHEISGVKTLIWITHGETDNHLHHLHRKVTTGSTEIKAGPDHNRMSGLTVT